MSVAAVWSFWTKPFDAHHCRVWLREKHHLLAWVLSVELARRHYPTTALFTDARGARLLVDRLGLEFTHVSTALDALRDAPPDWWVLGKLWTYRAQRQPYVHLDSDVFLWRPLPNRMHTSPVLAQNVEWFVEDEGSWYRPHRCDQALRAVDGWTPDEWRWYTAARGNRAVCCGILGGTDVDFLAHYADAAIRMIEHPANQMAWARMGSMISDNILVEQYLLAACLEFHQNRRESPYRNTGIEYLFTSSEEAFDETAAAAAGYTHLIGAAKGNRELMQRLERRVRRDFPHHYERCLRTLRTSTSGNAGDNRVGRIPTPPLQT